MLSGVAKLVGVVALCAAGSPVLAAPSSYDVAFVKAFEDACVPGRLTYATTQEAVRAAGWEKVELESNSELGALLAKSAEVANDPEIKAEFEYAAYTKLVDGLPHHLVASRTSAKIEEEDEHPFVLVGCYLYNLDATAPVDPAPVTALIGNPISRSQEGQGAISHVWGPPCPMPRTGDTYLSYVAEGSELTAQVPFTGVALNFSTSELRAGEPVPDPYC
jgi:hypothetical protein